MGKYSYAFKKALTAFFENEELTGNHYSIADKKITCSHCANEKFVLGKSLLNSKWLSFINMDAFDKSIYNLTCINCTEIRLFGIEPEKIEIEKNH